MKVCPPIKKSTKELLQLFLPSSARLDFFLHLHRYEAPEGIIHSLLCFNVLTVSRSKIHCCSSVTPIVGSALCLLNI